jgi:hypothetical protein
MTSQYQEAASVDRRRQIKKEFEQGSVSKAFEEMDKWIQESQEEGGIVDGYLLSAKLRMEVGDFVLSTEHGDKAISLIDKEDFKTDLKWMARKLNAHYTLGKICSRALYLQRGLEEYQTTLELVNSLIKEAGEELAGDKRLLLFKYKAKSYEQMAHLYCDPLWF